MGFRKNSARRAHNGIRLEKLCLNVRDVPFDVKSIGEKPKRSSGPYQVDELGAPFNYTAIPDEVLVGSHLNLSVHGQFRSIMRGERPNSSLIARVLVS